MKLLFEFFPIVLFFVVFKVKGIFFATAVAIAASIAQIAYVLVRRKKVEPMMWINLAVIAVFGGSTLLLHNELFIKWKPTILYWAFAGTLFVSRAFLGKNLMQAMLQKQIQLPDRIWKRMNASWSVFFVLLGAVNLYVAYNYSTAAWVNFKLFGCMGCMLVFIVIQSILISPHIVETGESKPSVPQ